MAADERTRRFRTHVVQELFDTEKEYTAALEFTVTHIMSKMRLKAQNDKTLTEETISAIFCNMTELLSVHQDLVRHLEETLAGKPSYESTIAGCYLRHKEQFAAYKVYGENNERAQKALYELEENTLLKAFFLGVMLLGGKSDVSISSYVFKPIQRICKYPLLFKELLKYTPEGHDDYKDTEQALVMLRELCSVINEARRRVEKLEAIADWQSTVEGWEGSPVVDTCNELVKEGPLIKISAGNMQERVFFLFDNLLVYCKKGFQLRTKAEQKTLLFRGRIPVESLEMENINDGTADYHTSGVTVCNGWKVRNIAKNKWFVLVARTAAEKQQWIEAFRVQKDRIKRVAAGLARDRRSLMLDKGSKLHCRLKQEGRLLQDHRYRIRVYPKSFCGSEFVKWLIEIGEAGDSSEAVRLGQGLLESAVIHHVSDKHQFKDSSLIYRFRYDDGTFHSKWETSDSLAKGVRAYARLHSLFDPLIKDQRTGLRLVRCAISGQRLIDWLSAEHDIASREAGVVLGSHLMAIGFLKHVTDDHKFKDSALYYRFIPDHQLVEEGRKSISSATDTPTPRVDFISIESISCVRILVPYTDSGYGFTLQKDTSIQQHGSGVIIGTVEQGSLAEQAGMSVGQHILDVNCLQLMEKEDRESVLEQCVQEMTEAEQRHSPMMVTIARDTAELCTLQPNKRPLGFQIKGTCPVVIQRVDKGSVAAQAGLTPGCCILKVEGDNMVQASHDKVVDAIKATLSKQEGKEPSVTLKIGLQMVEHIHRYNYESTEDSIAHIQASCMDSRYTYSLPSQLFKLYTEEASLCCKLLSVPTVTEQKVQDYVTELDVLISSYNKVHKALLNPRYPSYRPHGTTPSPLVEPCPINLHTFGLTVSTNTTGQPSTVQHLTTCSAVPTLMNKTFTTADQDVLSHCHKVRNLLAAFDSVELELLRDAELLQKLTNQSQQGSPPASSSTTLMCVHNGINPGSSPLLNQRGGFTRSRAVSVVDPNPVIKLILDGVAKKLRTIRKLCEDEFLVGLLSKTAPCVRDCTLQGIQQQYEEALTKCSNDMARMPDSSPKSVDQFSRSLLSTIKPVLEAIKFHLYIAISLRDNVDTAYSMDRMFSQCLVTTVTAFAYQLCAAIKGQLNSLPDYNNSSTDASQQWLELIAEKGVCVCFTGLLQSSNTAEFAHLKDLRIITQQLKTVSFFIKETAEFSPSNSTLPLVTLAGDHSNLQVTFHLPSTMMETLPDSLASGAPITVHPVLFNKGLVEMREDSEVYQWEQELNDAAFVHMRDYYRALRHFHLNRTTLPEDAAERSLALEQISQPLVTMDVLVQQLEVAIREPNERGVGLLSLLSELTQRMGGVKVLTCDSGVYRCQAALTLEEVLLMVRCHGLPPRCLRSALTTLRKDFLPLLEKKNTAECSKAFPEQPPWLYDLNKS